MRQNDDSRPSTYVAFVTYVNICRGMGLRLLHLRANVQDDQLRIAYTTSDYSYKDFQTPAITYSSVVSSRALSAAVG
jgi:hypothetical protein